MKRHIFAVVFLGLCALAGCSVPDKKIQGPGLLGQRLFVKAEPGMTEAEVKETIGSPQRRSIDVSYKGKTYDELWFYETTRPATILYFNNGILEEKDYQYGRAPAFSGKDLGPFSSARAAGARGRLFPVDGGWPR